MTIRITLVIFMLLSFFSCEKMEEKTIEDPVAEEPIDEPAVVDQTKPELIVIGFTDIIETTTSVSISIVDESTVETKVIVNEEELMVSTEKEFELNINPYIIPVGATDFTVVSIDAKGNEFTKDYSVEIKHLLMNFDFGTEEANSSQLRWVFFNSLEGIELAVTELAVGSQKIYTEEIILDNKIFFSIVNHSLQSISDERLFVSTYIVPLGESRFEAPWNSFQDKTNTVDVKLNGIPFENYAPDYSAYGYNFFMNSYSGDEQQSTLKINYDAVEPIYIRTNRWGGSLPKFDGKKENYRYAIFTPDMGNTNLTIEANELLSSENNLKLDIPDHDPGTLFFQRNAFVSAEDFENYKYYSIYDISAGETDVVDYLDLPIIPLFSYYDNNLLYTKNGFRFSSFGTDENLEINMPDWPASIEKTDATIEITANNEEVDYYTIRLEKSEPNSNGIKRIYWSLNIFGNEENAKLLPLLSLPELITEEMNDPFFESIADMEVILFTASDFVKFESYDQIIQWLAFNKNAPISNESNQIQLGYPISSYSGKTDKIDLQNNLGEFNPFGLDQNNMIINR